MRRNTNAYKFRQQAVQRYRLHCLQAVKNSALMSPSVMLDDFVVADMAVWIEDNLQANMSDDDLQYARDLALRFHRRERRREHTCQTK